MGWQPKLNYRRAFYSGADRRAREDLRFAVRRRTDSPGRAHRTVAFGGGRWLRRGTDITAHECAGGSAGLAIALVDRTNLSDALENWRVQKRTHGPVGERPTEAKRLRPRSWGGAVARKQDGGALRQHARKGVCATHQVATCSERRSSLVTRVVKDDVETGEALDARRRKLAEEMACYNREWEVRA